MPRRGYWIECIPYKDANEIASELNCHNAQYGPRSDAPDTTHAHSYKAILSVLPELQAVAHSPDQAIERLQRKLRALGRYYRMKGRALPDSENPVTPPNKFRSIQGWMSVYLQYCDRAANRRSNEFL